jgi:ribonuclease BN (tRNA processing enzyme)
LIGPADDLPLVVKRAISFLQAERFAPIHQELRLVTLEPGATWQNERYEIQTIRALHPVSGFCGRLLDQQSGVVIAFSGDTAFNPALSQLARGADLLIHEASVPPQHNKSNDHSSAADAARIAREADVQMLRLVHAVAAYREASLSEAQAIFPRAELAAMGETLTWPMPQG